MRATMVGALALYALLLSSYLLYDTLTHRQRHQQSRRRRSALRTIEERVSRLLVSRLIAAQERNSIGCAPRTQPGIVRVTSVLLGGVEAAEQYTALLRTAEMMSGCNGTLHFYALSDEPTVQHLERLLDRQIDIAGKRPTRLSQAPHVELRVRLAKPWVAQLPETVKSVNAHYSGTPALLKLRYADVFPELDRVISLDIDTVVLGDLEWLWTESRNLFRANPEAMIAMATEQSEWYKGGVGDPYRWPHVGRGFNSGVMVMNLQRLRRQHWSKMWLDAFHRTLRDHPDWHLQLGDQDIFNAAFFYHPQIVVALGCGWNLQDAGLKTEAALCPDTNARIFHANFFAKRDRKWRGLFRALWQPSTSRGQGLNPKYI